MNTNFGESLPKLNGFGKAPHVTLSSPSHAKNACRSWFALLLVMGITFMGLMSAGCGTQPSASGGSGSSSGGSGTGPPPPPPPPPSLVGSWTSNIVLGGLPLQEVYTFNSDGTFLETDTNQAGKRVTSSGSYTCTGDQVTISDSSGMTEQAAITWDDPNQIHYKITKNNDASQVGMDIVRTRQSQVVAGGSGAQPPPPPPPGSAIDIDVIAQAYKDNELRANQLYGGKVLTIVGKTTTGDDIISTGGRERTLVLASNVEHLFYGPSGSLNRGTATLLCTFSEENTGQLTSVNKGDVVTIQGTCRGNAGGGFSIISFDDCRIVSKP